MNHQAGSKSAFTGCNKYIHCIIFRIVNCHDRHRIIMCWLLSVFENIKYLYCVIILIIFAIYLLSLQFICHKESKHDYIYIISMISFGTIISSLVTISNSENEQKEYYAIFAILFIFFVKIHSISEVNHLRDGIWNLLSDSLAISVDVVEPRV